MKILGLAVVLFSAVLSFIEAQASPLPPAYVIPPAGTSSLVRGIVISRSTEGGILVSGQVALPTGAKILVRNVNPRTGSLLGQVYLGVLLSGSFGGGGFMNNGTPWPPGAGKIEILAMFNNSWQSPAVQAQIGGGSGAKLPQSALVPDDPRVPNGPRHLDEFFSVTFPPISDETKAIEHVKVATLSTPNGGRSSAPVDKAIDWHMKADKGVIPGTWSASEHSGKWDVVYRYTFFPNSDAPQSDPDRYTFVPETATWEYDPATGKVKYLDPNARHLSWLSSS